MKKDAKPKQDLHDVEAIFDDLVRFSRMTFEEFKSYAAEHLNQIDWFKIGPRSLHMSIESTKRFYALTDRQLAIDPSSGDLDRSTLNQFVRQEFGNLIASGRNIDQSFVDRMLSRAVKHAIEQHRSQTHYLPCVIVGDHDPREFTIGPVRFLHRDTFFMRYGEQIERDHFQKAAENRQKLHEMAQANKHYKVPPDEEWDRNNRNTYDTVTGYYKEHRWVAEVTVPSCDKSISRQRAELTVQAALDILKVFFGSSRGKRIRLAVNAGVPDKSSDLVREDDGRFEWVLHYGGGWAHCEDGWFDQISELYGAELSAAGQAISTYLSGKEPKQLAKRWLDALHWYGQGVSERITSAQIVKYVAALERLSITEKTKTGGDRGLTDAVSRRTALFAIGGPSEELEKARVEAREMYDWRSSFMHGRSSPISKQQLGSQEMKSAMYRAENLLRSALFGALAVYANLIIEGKSSDKHLEERLRQLEESCGLVERPSRAARIVAITKRRCARVIEAFKRVMRRR